MDPTIKMMIQGYIDGLDNMPTSDSAIKQEVEDFKKELMAFGESNTDAMTFYPKLQDSGLLGKYMNLVTKITTSSTPANEDTSGEGNANTSGDGQKKHIATPAEWLEPFRTAYNFIKDYPIREKGLSVYRKLFEIGEKHSYITEFLIELEKENILWKLTSEDTIGILEITLTGMDPLNEGLTYSLRKNIETWNKSICEADAYYLQDILSADIASVPKRLLQRDNFVACLGLHLIVYRGPKGKEGIMEMIATGNYSRQALLGCASNMVIAKMQTKRTIDLIKKTFGLSFDDIIADEYLKYKLISTSNVCGLSKAYVQSNSNILDLLADAYHNEIVPDISPIEAIKREPSLKFGRWRMPDDSEHRKAQELARKTFQDLPYFKYEDQLKAGNFHVGTGEGFEIEAIPKNLPKQ